MADTMVPFFENQKVYEITINLTDSLQFFGKGNRDGLFRGKVPAMLTTILDNSADYYLIPEISMPKKLNKTTSQPRIHYHGILRFHDVYNFLLCGYYSLGLIADIQFNEYRPLYWKDYCHKNGQLFKRLPKIRNCSWKTVELGVAPILTGDEVPCIDEVDAASDGNPNELAGVRDSNGSCSGGACTISDYI